MRNHILIAKQVKQKLKIVIPYSILSVSVPVSDSRIGTKREEIDDLIRPGQGLPVVWKAYPIHTVYVDCGTKSAGGGKWKRLLRLPFPCV